MVELHNCSCMEVMKNLPDESIDLIATDPPYRVMARGSSGNAGGMLLKDINRKGKVFEFNAIDCEEYAPEFYRILKDGSHCYVMTNHINLIHTICLLWNARVRSCRRHRTSPRERAGR